MAGSSSLTHALHSLGQWCIASGSHLAAATAVVVVAVAAAIRAYRPARARLNTAKARRRGNSTESATRLDPFTVYVALMAAALSINGMWLVFSKVMPLPGVVRVPACTVLESAGWANMRTARREILAQRRATRHIVTVWACALVSGSLSAGASTSILEAIIRLILPPLAVQLCHTWMLPRQSQVTLTQHEQGRVAWRYIKARRRTERAGNRLTRWIGAQLFELQNSRLTKRAVLSGDTSRVLAAAQQNALHEALTGLGALGSINDPPTKEEGGGRRQKPPEAESDAARRAARVEHVYLAYQQAGRSLSGPRLGELTGYSARSARRKITECEARHGPITVTEPGGDEEFAASLTQALDAADHRPHLTVAA